MLDEFETPKRRAPVYGRPAATQAKLAMAPFNARIAVWHIEVARIRGAAMRGLTASEIVLAREIERDAMMELGKLGAVVAALDPSAAKNSRVQDTRLALERIAKAAGEFAASP